jgi:hypothetical protein
MSTRITPWEQTAKRCDLCGRFMLERTSTQFVEQQAAPFDVETYMRCPSADCDNHEIRPSWYYEEQD